jgi:hypothetical protein
MRRIVTVLMILAGIGTTAPLAAQQWEEYDYENLEFRGVGIDVGWIFPPRVDQALSLGVRVDLGNLGPNIRIRPSIGYWSSQMQQREVDRLAEQIQNVCLRQYGTLTQCPQLNLGRIRMSDLMVNLDAQYEFTETPFLFVPFAGLGAGIHLLNGRGEAINDTFIEDFLDSVSPSLNLLAGVRLPVVAALDLQAEGRYVLSADIRHAAVSIGATWLFPSPAATATRAARRVR